MQKFIDNCYKIGLLLLSVALIHFSMVSEMKTTELGGIVGWNTTFLHIPLLFSILGYFILGKTIDPTDFDNTVTQILTSFGFAFVGSYLLCLLLSLLYTNFGIEIFKTVYFSISFFIIGLILYKKNNQLKVTNK